MPQPTILSQLTVKIRNHQPSTRQYNLLTATEAADRTQHNAAMKLLLEQIWQIIFTFYVSSSSRPVH